MTSDRALGMGLDISRRDFVSGSAIALGAIGSTGLFGNAAAAETQSPYPPARTGMRGSHDGSFEAAHGLRDGTLSLGSAEDTGELYDCVIVGGGLSGLAAAHFFRAYAGERAKVLILDNHDDFGGHAKRNEFRVDGKLLTINGGTLNIEGPADYDQWSLKLLSEIGVDLPSYVADNKTNAGLYHSLGLREGIFFDAETWGKDRLHVFPDGGPLTGTAAAALPIPEKVRNDLARLLAANQPDYLAGKSVDEKKLFLATTSLRDYYLHTVGIGEQAMWFYQSMGQATFCVGADATPALFGWVQGYPGFSGLGLGEVPGGLLGNLPSVYHGRQRERDTVVHFPDGNATLARLLVSRLIPGSVNGTSQEDMGTAVVDYGRLDVAGQPARLRLSSIVLNVRHVGDPATAKEAVVSYVRDGRLSSVRAGAVVMACWNMVIPYLVPDLPTKQKEALAYGVKGPLVYSSVALRNWRSFEKLGISGVLSQSMFHQEVGLTEAASLGALRHPQSPGEPIALHLVKYMVMPGLPRRDQHRVGRAELLATSFETFERETRRQLARILAGSGFDPARDIAAITVNRWPHGYAYTYNSLYDPVHWVYGEGDDRPCVIGRQPFGLITIANSDAAATPHTDAAIHEAHRAVSEAITRKTYSFVSQG